MTGSMACCVSCWVCLQLCMRLAWGCEEVLPFGALASASNLCPAEVTHTICTDGLCGSCAFWVLVVHIMKCTASCICRHI